MLFGMTLRYPSVKSSTEFTNPLKLARIEVNSWPCFLPIHGSAFGTISCSRMDFRFKKMNTKVARIDENKMSVKKTSEGR